MGKSVVRSGERMVRANGVELCVETFGDPADPAILLIMGKSGSMDRWPDELCERLGAGPRYVIRYDHRDTGRSVSYPPGAPGYGGADLEADAVGVLDALGVARAHLVGLSMGGGIAQLVTLDHPDRVASLTLMSTTAGAGDPDLPGMSEELDAYFAQAAEAPTLDWSDRAAVIDYMVDGERPFAARSRPYEEAEIREVLGRVYDRTVNIESSLTNHWILDDDRPGWRGRLGEVRVPTLVMHGTEDPLFPFEHGEALAREIAGAELVPFPHTGHELPLAVCDVVAAAVLRHTAKVNG